jgi:redox-regulated HSP33 family molecular chaperone
MEGLLQLESRFQPYDIASKNRKIDADSELCHELEQMTLERVSDIKFIFQCSCKLSEFNFFILGLTSSEFHSCFEGKKKTTKSCPERRSKL